MKKIFLLIITISFMTVSCKDEVDELFLNPDGATFARIDYLFTDAITDFGAGLRLGYNPSGFYLVLQGIGPWMHITGNVENDANMMDLISNAVQNSWNSYYINFLSRVSEMEIIYNELPAEEQVDFDIYMNMIKVVKANGTAKITDLYGDIPYSEAGKSRAPEQNIFPKFDSQKDIYTSILNDLKEASSFFSSFQPNGSQIHATVPLQDLLNDGNLDKWIKMANSLRLRYAMRISDADPSLAQTVIQEVANSPLVLTNEDNIYFQSRGEQLNDKELGRAFDERPQWTYAVDFMVNMMLEANDPRVPYHFAPNADGQYIGIPVSPDALEETGDISAATHSQINPFLIRFNNQLPGIVITASEVNFLLAEAVMKGYISGDAETYYNTALEESVNYYYQLLDLNANVTAIVPDADAVANFISSSNFAFDGTMEQLATQKWLHFGVLQVNEAYAEYRRTDFPVFPASIANGDVLEIPTRVIYPDTEKNFNEENYQAVRAQDTPNTPVWWDTNQ